MLIDEDLGWLEVWEHPKGGLYGLVFASVWSDFLHVYLNHTACNDEFNISDDTGHVGKLVFIHVVYFLSSDIWVVAVYCVILHEIMFLWMMNKVWAWWNQFAQSVFTGSSAAFWVCWSFCWTLFIKCLFDFILSSKSDRDSKKTQLTAS